MTYYRRIAVIAFLIGVAAPFIISVIAVMVSFEIGVWIWRIAVPLASVEPLGLSMVEIGNGIIYAVIAVSGAFLIRRLRSD